jgi:hypothetical protein
MTTLADCARCEYEGARCEPCREGAPPMRQCATCGMFIRRGASLPPNGTVLQGLRRVELCPDCGGILPTQPES